ncbi:hypothetical protein ACE198_16475 [Neobacillus sp. KR4-4]|uniref:hypothetical protein n=1 Tax=Neobacillus sp. KR4-4 TaxID=3344872 RepID=UPI0035CB98D9
MHNSYWYYALLVLSISLFSFILFKKRNTQSLYLLLTNIGGAFLIETVIYNFLACYNYNPNFIKANEFYDNNLGAFVSNAFALPVVATLIAVFHLNWIWIIFFSNRIYSPGWFENPGRDSIALGAIFYLCDSLYYCLLTKLSLKRNWIKYIFTGFLMYVVNLMLINAGILRSLVWWDIPYYVGLSILLLMLTEIIDKRLSQLPKIPFGYSSS